MTMVIGALDIGGTKMAATIATAGGPLARISEPTVKSGATDAPALQAVALLERACTEAGIDPATLQDVGVSSCGPFVIVDGTINLVTPNICGGIAARGDLPNDWTQLPLQRVLEQHFGNVVIRNDCIAALHGERMFGVLSAEPNCVYVTWSTGIGFGLCVDGHLLSGKQGNAGHAGHLLMAPDSTIRCGCGNLGDLEALISGSNISRGLSQDTPALFAAARSGETAALASVTAAAVWLGRALYNLVVTLDTRVFVIGGSVWQHHGDWLMPIVQHEIDSRFAVLTAGVTIVSPGLDAYVTDVGALCLVMPPEWISDWRQHERWRLLDHLPNCAFTSATQALRGAPA